MNKKKLYVIRRKQAMKVKALCVFLIMILVGGLQGCGKTEKTSKELEEVLDKMQGIWNCEGYLEPKSYDDGMQYELHIKGEKMFLYEKIGNPGIEGKIKVISESELEFDCTYEDEFCTPSEWEDMEYEEVLEYEFKSNHVLHITYTGEKGESTLVFRRIIEPK